MNDYPGDHATSPVAADPGADIDEDAVNPEELPPDPADSPADDADKPDSESWSFLKELPFLIVGALIVAVLVKSFLIQVFWIPSASMEETLQVGDRVIVNKLAYRIGDPGRGDVVVFEPESFEAESLATKISRNLLESVGLRTPESDLIKRVVGLPGETIQISDNRVLINDLPLDEPYLPPQVRMRDYGPEVIPDDSYFVMGDNRGSSRDSRVFGAIERSRIVGRAFSVVWPPSRWGGL
ncbi:MAG: signal peptidase I [Acidimicrobiia bacterium]|nr:signal peptidase I [Acidimicrobiia bacterium]